MHRDMAHAQQRAISWMQLSPRMRPQHHRRDLLAKLIRCPRLTASLLPRHPPRPQAKRKKVKTRPSLSPSLAPLAKSDDWVFANPETGKPYWPGRIQENWLVPAAEKAGIGRIGWHTFRHSHSTLLHALGVDLKVQQELLRPRRYSNDYGYLQAGGSDRSERSEQQSGSSSSRRKLPDVNGPLWPLEKSQIIL